MNKEEPPSNSIHKSEQQGQVWWFRPVVPAMQEVEVGGSRSETLFEKQAKSKKNWRCG
jgi:hypothetical protein